MKICFICEYIVNSILIYLKITKTFHVNDHLKYLEQNHDKVTKKYNKRYIYKSTNNLNQIDGILIKKYTNAATVFYMFCATSLLAASRINEQDYELLYC